MERKITNKIIKLDIKKPKFDIGEAVFFLKGILPNAKFSPIPTQIYRISPVYKKKTKLIIDFKYGVFDNETLLREREIFKTKNELINAILSKFELPKFIVENHMAMFEKRLEKVKDIFKNHYKKDAAVLEELYEK